MSGKNIGKGCKDCLVNKGVVHPEECIGCDGRMPCNHDYFPYSYNPDGSNKKEAKNETVVG